MYHKYITQKEFKRLLENSPSNARFVVYYVSEGRRVKVMKPKNKKKYTLNEIGDALFEFIKTTNERLDRIEARLDYNNLKKLPKNHK